MAPSLRLLVAGFLQLAKRAIVKMRFLLPEKLSMILRMAQVIAIAMKKLLNLQVNMTQVVILVYGEIKWVVLHGYIRKSWC